MTPALPHGGAAAAGDEHADDIPAGGGAGPVLEEGPPDAPGAEPGAPDRHLAHTWEEAWRLAFDCATPIPAAPVALRSALGRVLDADVPALVDMPHYASSAMDGWAVNGGGPWILAEPGQRLAPHQASPIATGGLIPPGAKAVLRSESGQMTADEDGLPVLRLSGGAKPGEPRNGEHVRKAAEEAAAGEVLIKRGTLLNPAHLALAAVAGHDTLPVLGKALVRLVFTGSEVVTAGIPQPGEVRDTFGPQLTGVVEMLGGICAGETRIGDTYPEWLAALEDTAAPETAEEGAAARRPVAEELPADVVITTGGTGRSGTDHLRRSVAELGGRLLIDGVAMRPGHPAVLAELPDGRFIIGLPGNPLAAMMALSTIGAPLLAALGHRSLPPVTEVPCGSIIDPDPGRTRLVPFRLVYGMASPAQHTAPGMMRGLAAADGVLVVPPHGVQLGEPVPAFALPWGTALPDLTAPRDKPAPKRASRKPAGTGGPVDWGELLG
ncbi:MAG: molybdopterin molybdotransferase MoeA [Arthrobacter sp.]